jgi:colanic acid biosynthesis glycosyl transferase WcaI
VTVVGIYYAPDSTGIAPYTTDLCETLIEQGASVHAIVGVPHYPQWTVDPRYRGRPRYEDEHNGVRVTRVRHFVPRSQDVLRRGAYEATFWVNARRAARTDRPDLVLGVTPNLAGAAAAGALAGRCRVPLGIVVQDLVGLGARQSGIRGGTGLADRIARMEANVLRRADRIAVITDAFVPPLLEGGIQPGRIDVLPNYVHVTASAASRADARRRLGWPLDRPIAVHAGNMGLKQGLHTVVEAGRLADRQESDLLIMLVGDGSTRRALEERATNVRSVRFVAPLPPEGFSLALAAADCLLLNERSAVSDMSLPSKLTSYLNAGRPVVAATSPNSATAAEVRRSGAGVLVPPGDPVSLFEALQRTTMDPTLTETLGRAGRTYAREYLSRTSGRSRILTFVGRTISAGDGVVAAPG